jgi:hypothetical protein
MLQQYFNKAWFIGAYRVSVGNTTGTGNLSRVPTFFEPDCFIFTKFYFLILASWQHNFNVAVQLGVCLAH